MSHSVLATARTLFGAQDAVLLDRTRLGALLEAVPRDVPIPHAPGARAEALALLFGAVNWRFFAPDGTAYRPCRAGHSGSAALRTRMAQASIDWTDFRSVAALSQDDWNDIVAGPLCDKATRYHNLTGLARYLSVRGMAKYSDQFGGASVPALVGLLVESGRFFDPFLKRAQSTIFDVSEMVRARTGTHLQGIETLTLFADYRLIQLFLHYGIIVLQDDRLHRAVLERHPLAPNAPTTLALRAAVVLCSEDLPDSIPAVWDKRFWHHAKALEASHGLHFPPLNVHTDQF